MLKLFKVKWAECHVIEVEADSEDEAREKAIQKDPNDTYHCTESEQIEELGEIK